MMKKLVASLLALGLLVSLIPITAFPVLALESEKVSLDEKPIVDHGSYQENEGDSTVFNLNGQGLSQNDDGETFNRYGNVSVDGFEYHNGFEVWLARWNGFDERSWAYATFDLGGEHESLVGKTGLIDSYNTTDFDITVYFYSGDMLLASYRLTNEEYVNDIFVDVTGVELLKLYVEDNRAVSGGTSIALYDMFLDGDGVNTMDIPEDAVCYNSHYYKLYDDVSTWEEARDYCIRVGGHLATITSAEEDRFVYNYILQCGYTSAYFGLFEKDGEDDWQWCTGERFSYSNWAEDEPNNQYSGESYGMYYFKFTDGKWNDGEYNDATSAFVCEWDIKSTLSAASSSEHIIKVVDSSGTPIHNAKVDVVRSGVKKSYFTSTTGYVKFPKASIADIEFTVTAEHYDEYTTAGKNFEISSTGVDVVTLYKTEKAGLKLSETIYQDTNSSYNEVLGMDVNLVKGTKRLSTTNRWFGHFRILCSTNDTSNVKKYTLYQNGKIIKTSEDGIFNLKISEFSAGKNIYVSVLSKDDNKVITPLNLEICDDSPAENANISFGNEISVTIPDSVPFVGGSKVECDIPDLPIQFELEDGKLYAGLNVNFTEDKTIKEQYDDLKTVMNDVKKLSGYKVGKKLKGNVTKFLKKREKYNLPISGDVEAIMFGGGEVTWSEKGFDEMKIESYFLVDASLEKNWQTAISVVPVTIQIKVGIEGKLQASCVWHFKNQTLNGDAELNLKPYLNAFGGAGVGKYVGVGVYGDAEVDLSIQLFGTSISPGLNYVDLTGELGLKAYVGPFTYSKPFAYNTWHLYTRTRSAYNLRSANNQTYNNIYDSAAYAIDDVSYLKDQSEWLGSQTSGSALFGIRRNMESVSINPLIESTYRNAQPSIATNGQTVIMTYLGADTDREAQNVPVAMYSVYDAENRVWCEPIQVDTNQTADTAPLLYSDNNNIWLIYQDASQVYSSDVTQSEYVNTQNIVVYVYDKESNSFVLEQAFKARDIQYRTPKMTAVDGVSTLVWIAGNNSDVLGQGEDNSFVYSCYQNGSWSEPRVLTDGVCAIPDYAVGASGGQLTVLYVADTDNNFYTDQDKQLVVLNANGSTTIGDGTVFNLDFVQLPSKENETFIWVANEVLHTLNESGAVETVCAIGSPESVAVVDDKILFTSASATENDEDNSELFAIVYDDATDKYGEAIQISIQDKYIEKIDAVNLEGVELMTMTRKTVEITDDGVYDDCELSWAIVNDRVDLQIDNMEYKYSDIQDETIPLYVSVCNKGADSSNGYSVWIENADGETVLCEYYEECVAAGETKDIVVSLPLENVNDVSDYAIVIGEEVDNENDRYEFTFGYADLAVHTDTIKVGNQNTLVCTVVNEGLSTVSGNLLVYGEDEENVVIAEGFKNLKAAQQYTFIVDFSEWTDERILHCVVKSDETDYSEANNSESVYLDFSVVEEAVCQHIFDNCVCIGCDETSHNYDTTCDESCDICGEIRTTAHNYEEATCQAPKTCTICGATSGSKLSHKSDSGTVTKAATCTAIGTKTYKCTFCQAVVKTETIAKTVHKSDKGTVTKEATCKATGTKTYKCTACKAIIKTETIAKKAHTYKTTTTKATLSKNGSMVKKCTVCDKVASKTTIKYAKSFKLSATSYTYDGKAKTPTVTVKDSAGKTLKKGTDYTVTYVSGRKNAGTYKVIVKMIGKYTGTKTLSFKIDPVKIAKCKLNLSAVSYTYDGKVKTPTVVVKDVNGKTLKKNTDYTVTYASGRKNAGTYKVTVNLKGNYSGKKVLTFTINPPKTAVSKLTAGNKSVKVTIAKKTDQVKGYQIQYSTSKSLTNAALKTLSGATMTTCTLKNLKASQTYYVRVRTYKIIGSKKIYSDWSAVKSVKTKV